MQFVSWNCRGLGSTLKEEAIRDLVRVTRPKVLLIQETKMEEDALLRASNSFWKKGPGRAVSARGASGGLATFRYSAKLDLIEEEGTIHWLFTKLIHKDSGHLVSLFNMYVPVSLGEKKECWDSLNLFLNQHNLENLVVAGDLNVTLALAEKKGGSIVRDPAREWVEDLMMDWELEDIIPDRGKFTWSNKRIGPGHIAARLDCFLIQSTFLTLGIMATSNILPHYTSDHKPISLSLSSGEKLGPIPFRFIPIWVNQEGFFDLVANSWKQPVYGSPFYVWEGKLRRLKADLKAWAKGLSSPTAERIRIQKALERHQLALEDSLVTSDLINREAKLQRMYHKACKEEEIYWRVKSRTLWLQAGDKNTSFFHKQAQARKNYNSISEIQMQDQVIKDFSGIKEAAHSCFKNLYSAPDLDPVNPNIYPLLEIPSMINDDDNMMLNRPVSIREIKKALFKMDPDKAPGPDGFTARFYFACWDIIKKDLYRMVKKAQNCTKLGGSTNSSFLALIPKEKGAKNLADSDLSPSVIRDIKSSLK